jgi:NMD protein affecting ribosome stability and mRNA decay
MAKNKLSDGSIYCERCGVYIMSKDWNEHKGSKRCDELLKDRPSREKATRGALMSVNKLFSRS